MLTKIYLSCETVNTRKEQMSGNNDKRDDELDYTVESNGHSTWYNQWKRSQDFKKLWDKTEAELKK